MAVLEGLGAIAGNFAQGYRQAREQKTQQSQQQQQLDYEHANRLFQMADQVQDPKMKDTLFSSATRMLEQLESPTKTKANPKGIGAIFGSMFGIGHQKDTPAPGMANQPLGPAKPPELPTAPDAAQPGSQTYGNLGDMFGSALQSKTAEPATPAAASGPVIPPVPHVDLSGMPTTREMQSAAVPFQPPSISSPRGTPVSPMAQQMAPPAQPSGPPAGVQPVTKNVIPTYVDIRNRAIQQTSSPVYGFRDPKKQQELEQQYAKQFSDVLLSTAEQHLAARPHKTMSDALGDPDGGAELGHAMYEIGQYENAGMLPKGTLENWQKLHFEDVRRGEEKYNPDAAPTTRADANGNILQWDLGKRDWITTSRKDVPFDQAVDAAFTVPEKQRTPEQMNVIAGYLDKMSKTDRAKLSPTDQVQWDWLNDAAIKNLPIAQKATKFQSLFHPVQPGLPVLFNPTNPENNRPTPTLLDRGTGKQTPIPGAQGPGGTFNAEKYMIPYQPPAVKNAAGRMETPTAVKLYDPDQLINSHAAGDEAVSVDTLRRLLSDPSKFPPGGAKKVEDYINSLPGPYPTKK